MISHLLHLELNDARGRLGAADPGLRFDFEHVETGRPPLQRDAEGVAEATGRPVQLFARPLLVFVEHDAPVIGFDSRDVTSMPCTGVGLLSYTSTAGGNLAVGGKLAKRRRRAGQKPVERIETGLRR